jgi:imidazolonepropionase-like amidohydrolase
LFEDARLIVGDGSAPIENSAFLVEGETFTWVGKKGERQPSSGTRRVDLTGKTVIPALIDGHDHIGLVNERDGSNSKANYTRENLIDQLERYAYYGVAAALSMGLEADQELAYDLRDAVLPGAARFHTVGKGIAGSPIAGPPGEPRLGIPSGARNEAEGKKRVRELHARGVHFVKIWVDDRNGTVPKIQPSVYRAIIAEAHANGMEVLARNLKKIHDAGMVIGVGTDGTGDGFGAQEQMAAYTQCGMTAMEALVAATSTNARMRPLSCPTPTRSMTSPTRGALPRSTSEGQRSIVRRCAPTSRRSSSARHSDHGGPSLAALKLEQPGGVLAANATSIGLGDRSVVEPLGCVGGLFEGVVD